MLCSLHTAERTLRNRSINVSNELMSSTSTAHKDYTSHLRKRSSESLYFLPLSRNRTVHIRIQKYILYYQYVMSYSLMALKGSELLESNCKNFHLIHNFALRMYNVTKVCKACWWLTRYKLVSKRQLQKWVWTLSVWIGLHCLLEVKSLTHLPEC